MQKVQFKFHDRRPILRDREKLKKFIEKLFLREKRNLNSLIYIFCSDEYLLGINKEFLKHDFFTDIITFELSSFGTETEAEVYISADRVKYNAVQFRNSYTKELHRVIFHGALHLCGYKDKTKKETVLMRFKEEEYLLKYFRKT
jgi:rRNA maturation RNase YbeY